MQNLSLFLDRVDSHTEESFLLMARPDSSLASLLHFLSTKGPCGYPTVTGKNWGLAWTQHLVSTASGEGRSRNSKGGKESAGALDVGAASSHRPKA